MMNATDPILRREPHMATVTSLERNALPLPEERTGLTVADLADRFGPISFSRIRSNPAPGTATEDDVVMIRNREKLLYELVDGVLVRKTMGYYESVLAGTILWLLRNYVDSRKLGIVATADGMMRLWPGMIRIPDVSFIAADRLSGRRVPREPICPIVPDLAVEVLSEGNTKNPRGCPGAFRFGPKRPDTALDHRCQDPRSPTPRSDTSSAGSLTSTAGWRNSKG